MQGPDGTKVPNLGIYLEVVKNERLVFTDAALGLGAIKQTVLHRHPDV